MSASSSRETLLRLLDPVVSGMGLDLEDVIVTPAGKRRLLRVIVDQDGGVELDQVAKVSSAISSVLDDDVAMGASPYVLEVTSPGVDRPLTEVRHWRRNRGRLVQVIRADRTTLTGRIVDAEDDELILEVTGAEVALRWDEVGAGRVQVEFNRRPQGERPLREATSPRSGENGG